MIIIAQYCIMKCHHNEMMNPWKCFNTYMISMQQGKENTIKFNDLIHGILISLQVDSVYWANVKSIFVDDTNKLISVSQWYCTPIPPRGFQEQ